METQKNYSQQTRLELLSIITRKKRFCVCAIIMSFLMLFLPMYNTNSTLWGTSFPKGIFGVVFRGLKDSIFNSFGENKALFIFGLISTIVMIIAIIRIITVLARAIYWNARLNNYLKNTGNIRAFEDDLHLMYFSKHVQCQRMCSRPATKPLPEASLWVNFFLIILAQIFGNLSYWMASFFEGMYLVNPVTPNRIFLLMCVFLLVLLIYGGRTARMEKRVRVRIKLEDDVRDAKIRLGTEETPSFDETDSYEANEKVKRHFDKDVGRLVKKKKVMSIVGVCAFLGSLFLPLFYAPSSAPASPMIICLFDKLVLTDSGDAISFFGNILGIGSSFDWYYYLCLLACIPIIMKGIGCIENFVTLKKNSDEENILWFYEDYIEGKRNYCQRLDLTHAMNYSTVSEILMIMLGSSAVLFASGFGAEYQSILTIAVDALVPIDFLPVKVFTGFIPALLGGIFFNMSHNLMFSGAFVLKKYEKMSNTFDNHRRLLKQKRREEREQQERMCMEELEEKNRLEKEEAEKKRETEKKAEQEAMIAEAIARAMEEQEQKNEENIVNALKQYKELLDSGIITQEEFDEKKSQLLEKQKT